MVIILLLCSIIYIPSVFSDLDDIYESKNSDEYVPCDRGYYFFRDKCYRVAGRRLPERFRWNDALALCKRYGADLVSIQSQEEQDFVTAYLLLDVKWWAWTGLNDRDKEGDFKWSDGSAFNYSNWRPGEPSGRGLKHYNKEDDEDCVHLVYDTTHDFLGKWNDRHCDVPEYAFCETKPNHRKRSPNLKYCSSAEGGGWKYENSCFHIVMEMDSWQNAERYCINTYNGHLLTIRDTLQDFFLDLALPDIKQDIWIGIKIQNQMQQKWESGWYVSYDRFNKEERYDPDLCVARKNRKEWVTIPCTEQLPFICEATKAKSPVLKPPPIGARCPTDLDDWRDLGGDYCYYIEPTKSVTFLEANYECQRRGGNLLSLHSQEESDMLKPFIEYRIGSPEYDQGFFIGLLRLKANNEETFGWIDGSELSYLNWRHNEPNSLEEKCVEAKRRTMEWNDLKCSEKLPGYICSVKKIVSSSSRPDESSDCESYCITPASHLYGIISQCTEARRITCKTS